MPKTLEQYQDLYNEKADRLRGLMDLQRANFSDTPAALVNEIRKLDTEMIQIKAAIDALETVEELSETLPKVVDRRAEASSEHRNHIMVATVQATVAEFLELRNRVDDGFEELRRLIARNSMLTFATIAALTILVMLFLAGAR